MKKTRNQQLPHCVLLLLLSTTKALSRCCPVHDLSIGFDSSTTFVPYGKIWLLATDFSTIGCFRASSSSSTGSRHDDVTAVNWRGATDFSFVHSLNDGFFHHHRRCWIK